MLADVNCEGGVYHFWSHFCERGRALDTVPDPTTTRPQYHPACLKNFADGDSLASIASKASSPVFLKPQSNEDQRSWPSTG
jgi:hypothetical protein